LSFDKATFIQGEVVRQQATQLRDLVIGANVSLEVAALTVPDGEHLRKLASDLKQTLIRSEVVQG